MSPGYGAKQMINRMSVHRFAVITAASTVVLITAGGLVTSTGSGLAVPDWPLSYGTLFPPMVGGILYEHGHRMVAAIVGLLTVTLALRLQRREPRCWVRRLGLLAIGAIVAQGLLGGLTVLLQLPTAVSVAHACLAQAFFCLVISMAVVTSRWWLEAEGQSSSESVVIRRLAALTTAAIYIQLIIGAIVRHTGSGLAIPDFPRALGRWIPPLTSPQVTIHYIHRLGAAAVALLVIATVFVVVRDPRRNRHLLAPGLLMATLLVAQIGLGALTVWTGLGIVPATAHVACGALLLATSLVVTLRSFRFDHRSLRRTSVPTLGAPAATPRPVTP